MKYKIGHVLDVSQEFSIFKEAVVEDIFTKPNGSVYMKVRGIIADGRLSTKTYDLWCETAGLQIIGKSK